jgi:glycosyltransferase involved in cell wall biosynthesis
MAIIAIDYTPAVDQGGGIGRLVRDLITALAIEDSVTPYRLFVAGASRSQLPPPPGPNFTWHPIPLSAEWMARLWQRAHLPLPVNWLTGRIDLYHATDFVLPPVGSSVKTILTVHDLSFVRVPETAAPNLRAYLNVVVPRSVQAADHIIADSQATRDDLCALYGTSPDKITVLLSGVDPRFDRVTDEAVLTAVRARYEIGTQPYIFCIGTVQPRKNYSRVIQALAQLRTEGHDLQLVIAGGKGWLEDEMYHTLQATHMQEHVHLIGFARDEDLPALYSGAALTAFPSLYEGFGLPILESMACGTPVVTANVSSLPEVAGDAALLINPYDVQALTHSIRRLITDETLRSTLTQRGYEQVKQFTWAKAARQLRAIYQRVLTDV